MSRELAGEASRLRDIVMVLSAATGVGGVTFYANTPGRDELDPAATTAPARSGPERPLRGSDPLVARVLASPEPLAVTEDGHPGRTRVLVRTLDWAGEPLGILAFTLERDPGDGQHASDGPAGDEEATDLRRIASASALAEQAIAALTRAGDMARANGAMRARADVDRALMGVTQGGGGLSAVVRECARLTGKLVALFDQGGRLLTSAHAGATPTVRLPGLHEILARGDVGATDGPDLFIVPAGSGGLTRRKLVAPVIAGGDRFGWLVIDEYPSSLRSTDRVVAERAAAQLGSEFVVQRRVARVAWNAKTSLARQLVRGTQATEDLKASAEYLGVDAEARRVLAFIVDPGSGSPDESLDQELATALERRLRLEVLATRGSEGVLLLIEAPADRGTVTFVNEVKTALENVTATHCGPEAIVGVSTVCEPGALSRGYREAREVVRCIDHFAGHAAQRLLAVDDLGPARLFLANSDTSAIRGYVSDVLGPLLTGEPAMTDLLTTLHCYFASSRSVRTSAAQLGVHENTIRLRLARVATATGLDVAGDANDQLSVQTALLVLRLQGHPTLPHFGEHGASVGHRESLASDAKTGGSEPDTAEPDSGPAEPGIGTGGPGGTGPPARRGAGIRQPA